MKNINEKDNQHLYELNCLVSLRNGERISELAKKIENWVAEKKGELIQVEKEETPEFKGGKSKIWVDKRRLAYPVDKDRSGYYLNSWLKLDPSDINGLKRFLKLEREILRFAILAEQKITGPIPTKESVTLSEVDKLISQQPQTSAPTRERVEKESMSSPAPAREIKEKIKVEEKPAVLASDLAIEQIPAKEEEKIEEKTAIEEIRTAEIVEEEEKVMEKKIVDKEEVLKQDADPETSSGLKVGDDKKGGEAIEAAEKPEEQAAEPALTETAFPKDKSVDKEEKSAKRKKITLEELDKRLDDILNEDIL